MVKLYIVIYSSVMAVGLNDGGRGLNIAVIDPNTKEVSRVGHFDTYAEGKEFIQEVQYKSVIRGKVLKSM